MPGRGPEVRKEEGDKKRIKIGWRSESVWMVVERNFRCDRHSFYRQQRQMIR
jgi:hypothetical protein